MNCHDCKAEELDIMVELQSAISRREMFSIVKPYWSILLSANATKNIWNLGGVH